MHGHVDSIAPASGQEFALLPPDNATGNFTKVVQRIPVKIALDLDSGSPVELRPGMSVIPTVETKSQARVRQAAAALRASARFPEDSVMTSPAIAASIPALPASVARPERPAADPNRASTAVWVAVLAAMIGSFMAILNIQITNASLLNIEGGIGTGVDNGSWISTSYLIGEIVVIPLTDYLCQGVLVPPLHAGQRALFAMFSVACAFTHDLPSMIAMRGLQGFAGGVLIPMAFTLVRRTAEAATAGRPGDLRAVGNLGAGDRPDHRRLSHRKLRLQTIFFVNVVPTIVMVNALYLTLERQPMQLRLRKRADWAGIATMAIGSSAWDTVPRKAKRTTASPRPSSCGWGWSAWSACRCRRYPAFDREAADPAAAAEAAQFRHRQRPGGDAVGASAHRSESRTAVIGEEGDTPSRSVRVLAWTGLPQLLLIR